MKVSIHQPNFFPWLGFFNKVYKSNMFVFLITSNRSKTDKYLSRCQINNNDKKYYLSIPIGPSQCPIKDIKLPNKKPNWRQKFLNVISESYRKSPFFDQIYCDIEFLILSDFEFFYEYNMNILNFYFSKFNIDTKIFIDSDLSDNFGKSNIRNINICKHLKSKTYISGIGARSYNDENLYKSNSIDLVYQKYDFPEYKSLSSSFIAGLSIIDTLFCCGYDKTEFLIKK